MKLWVLLPNGFPVKYPWDLWDGSDRPAVGNWGLPKLFPLGQFCFQHVVTGNEGMSSAEGKTHSRMWNNGTVLKKLLLGVEQCVAGAVFPVCWDSQGWVWGPLLCISCTIPPLPIPNLKLEGRKRKGGGLPHHWLKAATTIHAALKSFPWSDALIRFLVGSQTLSSNSF